MNDNNNHIINEELLTRYLLGETNAEESALIVKWLEASPENRKTLQHHKTLIDMVSLSNQNIDDEWQAFKTKLNPRPKEIKLEIPEHKVNYRFWAIAASIAIIIGLSVFFIYFFNNSPKQLLAESHDQVKDVILADGSNISLNRNSSLEYPEAFGKKERMVKLKGEAYFKVKHDDNKPFVVETDKFTVTVLGTSFYVSSFEGQPQQVFVETGKVKCVSKTTGENIILNAGEKYIFDAEKKVPETITDKDKNNFAWKTASLVFVNEKMADIATMIDKTYGCQIVLKGKINSCTLTVNFENLTIDGVLNVLQTILDAKITRNAKNIEISGQGC